MDKNNYEMYMKKVFALALRGSGRTSPNPLVGAVIVKNNEVIAEGYHQKIGSAHAERVALEYAGKKAQGADLYVNLEPCFHYGRTPPCVEAIIEKRIKKVIICNTDPNPVVNGQSIKKLQSHGIEVVQGILEEEGLLLNEVFFKYIRMREPFVALKAALSLDGKIATSAGESKWITGKKAREDGHYLRQKYDAILVGINTVIADDPFLTCRIPGGRNPYRIVLDTFLRIPEEANILSLEDSPEKTIIFCGGQATEEKAEKIKRKARVIKLPGERFTLSNVLTILAETEIASILIEGGAQIHGSFIRERLVDKYYLYLAPTMIGGQKAPGFFGGEGFSYLSEAPRLMFHETKKIGEDLRMTLYPAKGGP